MGYADIMDVEATGASRQTAQQDRLGYSGVRASETMAETDRGRMGRYKSKINRVGNDTGIDPALIAGIISRESRAGNALDGGWGDSGKAWGLMQVDITSTGGRHTRRGEWDSEEHIRQATGILVYFIQRISEKFPNWSREEQLKGGIAAYNMGDGNVTSKNVDERTTGGDYSNDVVARAQWYRRNGF
ncbi:lysozyme g-like [Seriola lalandi dorsalis]|uniref:Lysozyme g n=1 Tax=Seriola lalandi dorsalis TaxID=1841481 RepID=A0A3B4WMJ1_SERLL|nr:lysozyme g-like [Seriola lalandi dorsalis]